MDYKIQYTSVDGSGFSKFGYETEAEAISVAKQMQAKAEAHGNEYGYGHRVLKTVGSRFVEVFHIGPRYV